MFRPVGVSVITTEVPGEGKGLYRSIAARPPSCFTYTEAFQPAPHVRSPLRYLSSVAKVYVCILTVFTHPLERLNVPPSADSHALSRISPG